MFSRMSEPGDMESMCLLTESDSDTFSRNHNIPDLPNTKDYHLFVCYTDYNSADVRVIVENLEGEGLKCCYHERDFQPGQNVFHNINSAIKRSMGIIIILSEESVNSSFCQHEIHQAVHTRITDDYTIIPIKIEPCDIPDNLKTTTYIDAQNIETIEVHKLILNAFLQDVWHVEHNNTNGLTRRMSMTQYKEGCKWTTVSRFKLLIDKKERMSLRRNGFVVSDARFDEMEAIVSNSFPVKYKHILIHLTRYTTLVFFILSLITVGLEFTYVSFSFGREMDNSGWLNTNGFIARGIFVNIIFWLCLIAIDGCGKLFRFEKWKGFTHSYEEKAKEELNEKLWNRINRETMRDDKYFVLFQDDHLNIVRFDRKPCQDVFVRRCQLLKSLTKYMCPGETDVEYTERLVEAYLQKDFIKLTIPTKGDGRHTMINGASCLCSLLENEILKKDDDDDDDDDD
ncbi:uncharacterized protein LOC132735643 [Ruditapes philippinarum]|uniref:uncharacterized protein LOC132735643 n=1 Tax=Ruditapes philippinarum TaxID=129788 RepID=UPI00295AADCC|nr:uncharacterized protein LOC132735643 [Ruditapes philippinarum]